MPTLTFSQAMASLREGASPPVALGILRYLQHYPRDRQRLSEGDLHLLTTTDDHQRALAEYYCGLWNDLDDAGLEPNQDGVAKVDAELADSPWVIVFDGGRWQTRHVDEMAGDGGDHPTRFAAQRAPKGYTNERPMVIGGKKFRGGQWIPSEQMKRATPEQKAEIEGAASGHAEKRRQRGSVDVAGLKKKLAPHAGHELSKHETTSARRSFGALLHHHGGLVVHRLEEMANDLHAAMEGADEGARGQFSRRLAAVNQMLGWAHEKGHEGKVGDGDAVKEEAATEKAPPSKAEPKDAPETADAPNYFELPFERGESATPTKEKSKEAPNYFELPSEREDAAKSAAAKPPPPAAPPKETPLAKPAAPPDAAQPGSPTATKSVPSGPPAGGEAKGAKDAKSASAWGSTPAVRKMQQAFTEGIDSVGIQGLNGTPQHKAQQFMEWFGRVADPLEIESVTHTLGTWKADDTRIAKLKGIHEKLLAQHQQGAVSSPVDHHAAAIAQHAAKVGMPDFDFAALKSTVAAASSLKAADVGHLANKLKVSYPKGTTKRELLARIERSVSERQATHERVQQIARGPEAEKGPAKAPPPVPSATPVEKPTAKVVPPSAPPANPKNAAPKSFASPGPIAGTLQYNQGKIPTPEQAGLTTEQEKATEKSLRNAYSNRSTFRGNETGLIPMDHLYADMQRDNPGLTREQFHAVVNKLWDSKAAELHILNEQRQLEDGKEHATMFLKDQDGRTKGYHYLYLKPQR